MTLSCIIYNIIMTLYEIIVTIQYNNIIHDRWHACKSSKFDNNNR